MAAFASPLKYNISEKISERNAAINNNLSVAVNLLNMMLLIFKFCMTWVENINLKLNLPARKLHKKVIYSRNRTV